jgi:hypothetical protein
MSSSTKASDRLLMSAPVGSFDRRSGDEAASAPIAHHTPPGGTPLFEFDPRIAATLGHVAGAVSLTAMGPASGKSIVALGLVELRSRRVSRVGFYRPIVQRLSAAPGFTKIGGTCGTRPVMRRDFWLGGRSRDRIDRACP